MAAALLAGASGIVVVHTVTAAGTAAPAAVEPLTFQATLATARPGATIKLKPGNYGAMTISAIKFPRAVTIDASEAQFTSLTIRGSAGLTIVSPRVEAFPETQAGITIDRSEHVTVSQARVSGARIAITVARSENIALLENDFSGTRSDGVNINESRQVRVERNICRDFNPTLPVYDAAGKLLKDGDHPDCVQAWSTPGRTPLSDISVIDNVAEGFMQGVFFSGNGGGFDRITITGNQLTLAAWNGIILREGRDSTVTGNTVRTIPGARGLNFPHHPVNVWIKVDGERNTVCGNTADAPRFSVGMESC